jgi:hypothetical protein
MNPSTVSILDHEYESFLKKDIKQITTEELAKMYNFIIHSN